MTYLMCQLGYGKMPSECKKTYDVFSMKAYTPWFLKNR